MLLVVGKIFSRKGIVMQDRIPKHLRNKNKNKINLGGLTTAKKSPIPRVPQPRKVKKQWIATHERLNSIFNNIPKITSAIIHECYFTYARNKTLITGPNRLRPKTIGLKINELHI